MTIRLFEKEDLNEVAKLFVAAFNAPPWNDTWTEELAYKRLQDVVEANRFIGLVAVEEECILGAVLGNLEYWFEGNHYNLKEIFVSHKAKGLGIGTQLLTVLEEILKAYDVTEQLLLTLDTTETLKFYEKNGYQKAKVVTYMTK